jgi:hypothetical protein
MTAYTIVRGVEQNQPIQALELRKWMTASAYDSISQA